MAPVNQFPHQRYHSERPTSPYHLLPVAQPIKPGSGEFSNQLSKAGIAFRQAHVKAIYCAHGTFSGGDALGLLTELSRFTPGISRSLSKFGKRTLDILLGETGNFTPRFAKTFQDGLAADSGEIIPVSLFNWSGQNNHIGRADGAIRLLGELADFAERLSPEDWEGDISPRVILWGHSHGGNVFALVANLLAVDRETRQEFFHTTRSFYRSWAGKDVDLPRWQKISELLNDADHPLRKLALDIVTFGTPIRYGWDTIGYSRLLHFIHHHCDNGEPEHLAPRIRVRHAITAKQGDFIQQIGIAGSNFIPLPCALRTFLADRRLDKFLERAIPSEFIIKRLGYRTRVPDAGTTLLVDYTQAELGIDRYLAGHTLYTRRKWLPFHCEQIVERLYGSQPVPDQT